MPLRTLLTSTPGRPGSPGLPAAPGSPAFPFGPCHQNINWFMICESIGCLFIYLRWGNNVTFVLTGRLKHDANLQGNSFSNEKMWHTTHPEILTGFPGSPAGPGLPCRDNSFSVRSHIYSHNARLYERVGWMTASGGQESDAGGGWGNSRRVCVFDSRLNEWALCHGTALSRFSFTKETFTAFIVCMRKFLRVFPWTSDSL